MAIERQPNTEHPNCLDDTSLTQQSSCLPHLATFPGGGKKVSSYPMIRGYAQAQLIGSRQYQKSQETTENVIVAEEKNR